MPRKIVKAKAPPPELDPVEDPTALRNLGPQSRAWLREVGLSDRAVLDRTGPAEAYRRIRALHPDRVNKTLLWAIAGALLDMEVKDIPPEIKQHLLFELEAVEKRAGTPSSATDR